MPRSLIHAVPIQLLDNNLFEELFIIQYIQYTSIKWGNISMGYMFKNLSFNVYCVFAYLCINVFVQLYLCIIAHIPRSGWPC